MNFLKIDFEDFLLLLFLVYCIWSKLENRNDAKLFFF